MLASMYVYTQSVLVAFLAGLVPLLGSYRKCKLFE
jgi:hypothetical protein